LTGILCIPSLFVARREQQRDFPGFACADIHVSPQAVQADPCSGADARKTNVCTGSHCLISSAGYRDEGQLEAS